MEPHLLFEPRSRGLLASVSARLEQEGLDHTAEIVDDLEAAARSSAERGVRFLVAVGNDEAVHHVAIGILGSGTRENATALGVLPVGECGVARTFGIPMDPLAACRRLVGDEFFDLDVGIASCEGPSGSVSTPFLALAEVGFGARRVRASRRLPRSLGRLRGFLGFWAGLAASGDSVEVETGRRRFDGEAWDVVVGNCQFLGDLRLSPRSFPGDGALDVLVLTGSRSVAFRRLPEMMRGEHVPDPNVLEMRGDEVIVRSPEPVPVQVDGIFVGRTPARFSVVPGALRFKV